MSFVSTKPYSLSHDQNFKNLILDYPRPALEFFAAEEVPPDLTQARIVPIRQEQLKERLGERFRELDIPLLVEWPDGRREAILFIVEEETDPRRFSVHRLAHYCLDIAELIETDRVVPVVIFLHPGQYPLGLRLGGDRDTYLIFRFIACDLGCLPVDQYLHSTNIVARLNLPNMDYPSERRIEVYASAQDGLVELEPSTDRRLKYMDYIDQYANLSRDEWLAYQNEYLPRSGQKEIIMGMKQFLREEIMQESIQQGEALILQRLLQRRFGPLPDWVTEKLAQADQTSLETWADRVLDATTLEEVFQKH